MNEQYNGIISALSKFVSSEMDACTIRLPDSTVVNLTVVGGNGYTLRRSLGDLRRLWEEYESISGAKRKVQEKLPVLMGKSVLIKTTYNDTEGGHGGRRRILSRYDDKNLYLIRGCDAEPVEVPFELSSVEDISEYSPVVKKESVDA